MRYPGGICVERWDRVSIRPKFIESLTFAMASHKLPVGEVKTCWKRDAERIRLEVECPEKVSCQIELDPGYVFEQDGNSYLEAGTGIYWIRKM